MYDAAWFEQVKACRDHFAVYLESPGAVPQKTAYGLALDAIAHYERNHCKGCGKWVWGCMCSVSPPLPPEEDRVFGVRVVDEEGKST